MKALTVAKTYAACINPNIRTHCHLDCLWYGGDICLQFAQRIKSKKRCEKCLNIIGHYLNVLEKEGDK
jgi:hypothetical protein